MSRVIAAFVLLTALVGTAAAGFSGTSSEGLEPLGPGSVIAVGGAANLGSSPELNAAAVVPTPTRQGYWIAGQDGSVHAFGDAAFHGRLTTTAADPLVDLAATPAGDGYWLVTRSGKVTPFGTATDVGSPATLGLTTAPIVAAVATKTGLGMWLAAADGGVMNFGDAGFFGSVAGGPLTSPIVDLAPTATGKGYVLLARGGGVFALGDAAFLGRADGLLAPAQAIVTSPAGYWVVAADGALYAFGDAAPYVIHPNTSNAPVTDAAATVDGLWFVTGGRSVGMHTATCYALRGRTASGRLVSNEAVAVDPRVTPLGTELWIEGEGRRVALDTGGNIKGRRIDVWKPSVSQCRQFGRKSLRVWTLG